MRTAHAQGAYGKRMRPVARMPIEFNGKGTTRFYYRRLRDADDLERLLANKRARGINHAFMQYNVNQQMSQRMDTGVRVNRALAGMYGIDASTASSSSSDPPKLNKVPSDAQLVVIGEAMSESTMTERDIVLVGIVV